LSGDAFYGRDLAFVHDAGFGDLARAAAGELRARMRRAGLAGGRVVDLGCGTGILAQRLAAAGCEVLGVDASPAMVALARRRAPAARFRVASLLDVELGRCDAVAIVGEGLNYLRDPRLGGAGPARLLARCRDALRPGGLLMLDVRVVPRGRVRSWQRESFRQGDGWAVAVRVEADPARRRMEREITVFRRRGGLYRRSRERHRVRLYRRRDLAALLRRLGFAVRPLRGYGGLRFGAEQAGFLARRR